MGWCRDSLHAVNDEDAIHSLSLMIMQRSTSCRE
jgi:hypothetical protein